jgi:hypothetical protein
MERGVHRASDLGRGLAALLLPDFIGLMFTDIVLPEVDGLKGRG